MTTEPGALVTTSAAPPPPTVITDIPEVPPPPGAVTMQCAEFNELDTPTRLAVVRVILAGADNAQGPENEQVAMTLAQSVCQFFAGASVNEVLLGRSPQ